MGNKHFSLLIETLELEEELSNTSLIDFSLNNIEKDNINKIWTLISAVKTYQIRKH